MKKYLTYKKQIEGFRAVGETVKIVEKSAASHIHFLKKHVSILLSYKRAVEDQLGSLLKFVAHENHPFLRERAYGKRALLVVGGDRGIVGGLYHDLVRKFLQEKNRYGKIFAVGNKVEAYLIEEGVSAEQFFYDAESDLPEPEAIQSMSAALFARFQKDNFRSIDILYPQFVSVAVQRPSFVQFLPFRFNGGVHANVVEKDKMIYGIGEGWPFFEPSGRDIFDALLKKYIGVSFSEIMLEAKLSEFSARTVTAEHAASTVGDIIQSLQRTFFKSRSGLITEQQLENFIAHRAV